MVSSPPALGISYTEVSLQYNALLTRATSPGTNFYSPRWEGPPVPELIEWGQLNALDLLNAGFAMLQKSRYAIISASLHK